MSCPRDFNSCVSKCIFSVDGASAHPYCFCTEATADKTAKYLAIDFVRLEKKGALAETLDALTAAKEAEQKAIADEKALKATSERAIRDCGSDVEKISAEAARQKPLLVTAAEAVKQAALKATSAQAAYADKEAALPSEWVVWEQAEEPSLKRDKSGYVVSQSRYVLTFDAVTRMANVSLQTRTADGYLRLGVFAPQTPLALFRAYTLKGFVSPLAVDEAERIRAAKLAEARAVAEAAKAAVVVTPAPAAVAPAVVVTPAAAPAEAEAEAAPAPAPAPTAAVAPAAPAPAPASAFDKAVSEAIFQ